MTDDELLQLVETKSPGELSLDEIQFLRSRLAESAEMREAFSSRLRLQTFLAEVLARIDLAPDDVLRANRHQHGAASRGGRWKWAALLLLAAALAAALGVPRFRQPILATVHRLTGDDQREKADGPSRTPDRPGLNESRPGAAPPEGSGDATISPDASTDDGTPAVDPPALEPPHTPAGQPQVPAGQPQVPAPGGDSRDTPASSAVRDDPPAADVTTDAPAAANVEPAVAAPPPWQAALLAEPARSLDALVFQRFETKKVLPQAADLHDWFDVIVGEPKGIVEARSKHGQCGAIEGILRLKAPWTDDAVLRFQLESYHRLQMHFFAGNQGVTLVYYADQSDRWAAYVTTRKPGGITPQSWRLTATDAGRNRRTEIRHGGPYQLRHRAGELLLTRGDIVLIRAPLSHLPEDVYLQGRATIVGLDWQRTLPSEQTPAPGEPAPGETDAIAAAPADLATTTEARSMPATDFAWRPRLQPETHLEVLPDDAIRLASSKAAKRSWATICRPRDNLYQIDLQLDDAAPGAGIYLGTVASPLWVLRYVRDNRTGQLCLLARGDDDHHAQDFRPLHEAILPSVGQRHWVRLVFGPSMVRWWLSVDGVHWAEADPLRKPSQTLTQIGLHCAAGVKCGVTLRRIRLTPLTGLAALADPTLSRQAMLPEPPHDIASWLTRVHELQPPGSSIDLWRRTAAVQTLAAGCPQPLGTALIDLLLDDAEARHLPLAEQLRLLDDAALLANLYDNKAWLQTWVDRYHRLGLAHDEQHDAQAFSSIRAALMNSQLLTNQQFDVFHPRAISRELLQLVYAGDWSATARFCRQLRFFHLQAKVPLFEWAEVAAARRTPEGLVEDLLTRLPETWRNLFVERQSKEVYNVSAELRALIQSEAFEDAARMIGTLDPRELPGVAVDARDDRLLVSLPAFITMADRRHPQLRAAVAANLAPLAELRLREYFAARDAGGVALVALQFPGTTAASEAYAWLGNRALAGGWFETALWNYRRAAEVAASHPSRRTDLGARISLARIMSGGETQAAAPAPRLGNLQLQIAEIAALQANGAAEAGFGPTRFRPNGFAGPHTRTVAPTGLVVNKRARFDGPVGKESNRILNGNIKTLQVDWVGRQLAVALDAERMYVSNRFQVAAYDRKTGARAWQSPNLPGRVRRAHDWSLTAMRPVLHGERIYARQLYGDTTSLACFDRPTGKPLWTAEHRQNIDIISDPMIIHDQLVCLTMARTSELESIVQFTVFDPETGSIWRERELVTLSNAWQRRQVCEVQPLRDTVIAVLGGVVISCDLAGELRWVSRQILLPPDEQPDWITQTFSPPLVFGEWESGGASGPFPTSGDRIYVTEPGVRTLQCLDPQTGERIWSRTLPDLRRLLGIAGGNLIVHGDARLLGLDPVTGVTRWQRSVEPLLEGFLCGGNEGVLVARRQSIDKKKSKFVPELVWLDGKTGEETQKTRLDGLEDADPRLGPMVVVDGQIWAWFGRGPTDPYRDVVQLVPSETPAQPSGRVATYDPWRRHIDEELHRTFQQRFPDWRLLGGFPAPGTGIVPEFHGEKEVLSLATRAGIPLVLGRPLDVPLGTHPRLRLALGSDVKRPGQLEVRFQGISVWQTEITPKTHTTPWKTVEVDLQDFAGQTGWLTVHARFAEGNKPVLLAWKQLDLVF